MSFDDFYSDPILQKSSKMSKFSWYQEFDIKISKQPKSIGYTLCFRPKNTQKMGRVEGILQKNVFFNKMLPTGRILKNKFIFRFFCEKMNQK